MHFSPYKVNCFMPSETLNRGLNPSEIRLFKYLCEFEEKNHELPLR